MTEIVKKLYVDGKVVAVGDFNYEVKEEPAKYTIKINYDEGPDNPHEIDEGCRVKWYSNHRDYTLDGNLKDLITEHGETIDDFNSLHDFLEQLRKESEGTKEFFPVYAYIHSGIALYSEPYTGPDARWDSGMFAIAVVDMSDEEKPSKERAREIFKADFKEMEAYITGEIYMYLILNENEECVDSCCGFHGDTADEIVENMMGYISADYNITKEDVKNALENIY